MRGRMIQLLVRLPTCLLTCLPVCLPARRQGTRNFEVSYQLPRLTAEQRCRSHQPC